MSANLPTILLAVVFGIFGVGLYGLLLARNLVNVVVALQIMVKGVLVALVLAGHQAGHKSLGQSMAVTVIVADTIIAVLGLALAVQVRRRFGTLDLKALARLRR